jgi:hypothetical protein
MSCVNRYIALSNRNPFIHWFVGVDITEWNALQQCTSFRRIWILLRVETIRSPGVNKCTSFCVVVTRARSRMRIKKGLRELDPFHVSEDDDMKEGRNLTHLNRDWLSCWWLMSHKWKRFHRRSVTWKHSFKSLGSVAIKDHPISAARPNQKDFDQ